MMHPCVATTAISCGSCTRRVSASRSCGHFCVALVVPRPTNMFYDRSAQNVYLTGSEVWNINQDGIDIIIEHKNVAAAQQYMEQTAFSYNIMIDDIETAIDETYTEINEADTDNTLANYSLPWLNREGALLTWRRYHDQGDMQQFLQNILETHSELAEIVQIGLTRNKRPLEVLRSVNVQCYVHC